MDRASSKLPPPKDVVAGQGGDAWQSLSPARDNATAAQSSVVSQTRADFSPDQSAGSPARRFSAPAAMAKAPMVHNLQRTVSSMALRTDSLADIGVQVDGPMSNEERLTAILGKIDGLWDQANALSQQDNGPTALVQRENLQTMGKRITRDLDTMRQALASAACTERRTVYSLFSNEPQLAAAAGQALAVCADLCAAVKPYCQPPAWRLFDALRDDLQKLSLGSGFGSSLYDLDTLFDVCKTLDEPEAPAPQPVAATGAANEPEEDELDRLIREYTEHKNLSRSLSPATAAGPAVTQAGSTLVRPTTNPVLPNLSGFAHRAPDGSALKALADSASAPGAAALTSPPSISGPVPGSASPRTRQSAGRRAVATKPALPSSPMVTPGSGEQTGFHSPRKLERNSRVRAVSSPPALSPGHRDKHVPAQLPAPLQIARWDELKRRDAPRAMSRAPASPRVVPKPSSAAPLPREVVGFAAAQMHWFQGTPGEFLELVNDNATTIRFLECSMFRNAPWRADMLRMARSLRKLIAAIDESFLVNSELALEKTSAARRLTLSLEEQFATLCAQSLHSREQVALFFARNLNWVCHKILGRAFQSLTVREKMDPRAVSSQQLAPLTEKDPPGTPDSGFRAPLPVRQTMISTRFAARVPREIPGSPQGNASAPVSPRHAGMGTKRSTDDIIAGSRSASMAGTGQASQRRHLFSDVNPAHAAAVKLKDISRTVMNRARSTSAPLSPPTQKAGTANRAASQQSVSPDQRRQLAGHEERQAKFKSTEKTES